MNWNALFTVPGIIFMIPIVGIICGSVTGIVKMCFHHRERIALIEQGLHPDYPPEEDQGEASDLKETIVTAPAEFIKTG